MLIPLGILASSGGAIAASSYELIETTILGSSAALVTFNVSGLGSTYKHLQIRTTHKADSSDGYFLIRFNSDTGSNYSWHQLGGEGSVVFSGAGTSQTGITAGQMPSTTASRFAASVVDFLDPFSSLKYKTTRTFTGNADVNKVILRSGLWMNTAAATSITLTVNSGVMVTGSRFSIYGIKG